MGTPASFWTSTIAHELGHALCAYLFGDAKPIKMVLKSTEDEYAIIDMKDLDIKVKIPGEKSDGLVAISDLGGILGELSVIGEFVPKLIYSDFTGFLQGNIGCIDSPLYLELIRWLFVEHKQFYRSYGYYTNFRNSKGNLTNAKMTLNDVKTHLPEFYRFYEFFLRNIDVQKFKNEIRLIQKKRKITHNALEIKRIVTRILKENI